MSFILRAAAGQPNFRPSQGRKADHRPKAASSAPSSVSSGQTPAPQPPSGGFPVWQFPFLIASAIAPMYGWSKQQKYIAQARERQAARAAAAAAAAPKKSASPPPTARGGTGEGQPQNNDPRRQRVLSALGTAAGMAVGVGVIAYDVIRDRRDASSNGFRNGRNGGGGVRKAERDQGRASA